ncbi:MAG: hypothetical protein AAF065_10205 [Verrucomicrobiota bacterium]
MNGAINIDNFDTLTNDRFANDASFIGAGLDFSGVAIADEAPLTDSDTDGRWLTMISPNVFLSVQHSTFFPNNGQSVTFYASNDPLGGSTTRTVQSSQQIGSSDVRIGVLDSPLPSNYAYYDYATETFDQAFPSGAYDISSAPYYEETAFIFGRSPTPGWDTTQDIAVGRNVLDIWWVDYEGTHEAVVAVYDDVLDPNYVSSEAFLRAGDSGGPVLVDDGMGGLTIIGLNWFSSVGNFSGFSYLGNYSEEIDAFIAANPVPEFRLFALLAGLCSAAFVISSRKENRGLDS